VKGSGLSPQDSSRLRVECHYGSLGWIQVWANNLKHISNISSI